MSLIKNNFDFFKFLVVMSCPLFLLRPYFNDYSSGNSFYIFDFIFIALCVFTLFFNFDFKFVFKYLRVGQVRISICFILTAFLAFLLSGDDRLLSVSVDLLQFAFVMLIMPLFFFLWYKRDAENLNFAVSLSYLVPSVLVLLSVFFDVLLPLKSEFFSAERAMATYGNSNSYALVLCLCFPLYLNYYFSGETKLKQHFGLFALVVSFICLLLTGSFSGFIILAVSVLVLFVVHFSLFSLKKTTGLIVALLLSVIALDELSPDLFNHLKKRIAPIAELFDTVLSDNYVTISEPSDVTISEPSDVTISESNYLTSVTQLELGSSSQRIELIKSSFSYLERSNWNVFQGVGINQSLFLPEFSKYSDYGLVVHNAYLQLWIEAGLLSVILFVACLLVLIKSSWALKNDSLTFIWCGPFVYLMVLMFNPHSYLPYFWMPLIPCFLAYYSKLLGQNND